MFIDGGDHSGHNQGSSNHMGHMMMMTVSANLSKLRIKIFIFDRFLIIFQFHFGCKETILFDQWDVDSVGGIIASVLVIVLLAIFYEGLKYYREYLFWKTYNALQYRAVSIPDKNTVVGASSEDTTHVK